MNRKSLFRGFTLIELLIVVAIIAILAAIAVPNFLEAQTRSKISRVASDMRTMRTGIESYRVDNNKYPETDTGQGDLRQVGVGPIRLTTPIAYLTSVPQSPFQEKNIGFDAWPDLNDPSAKNANRNNWYLWVNAQHIPGQTQDTIPSSGDGLNDDYNTDRAVYLAAGDPAKVLRVRSEGQWLLKSVGPNNIDDRDGNQLEGGATPQDARVYDPTNGTISAGDLVIFSDGQGFAQQQ